jgi:hypothetical protein
MKRFKARVFGAAAIVGVLISAEAARAASPSEEARFVTEVKRVTQKKDLPGLLATVCWDQVDAKTRKMVEGHLKDVLKTTVKDVALEDYPDFPFKANLKVVKKLKFVASDNESSSVPVGEKAGKLMIAVSVE